MDEQVTRTEVPLREAPDVTFREPLRARLGRRLGLALLAALLLAGALLWLHPWAGKQAARAPRAGFDLPQAVREAEVVAADVPVVLDELGSVVPITTFSVVSYISGYITKIAFTEGQNVKKGDLIVEVDPRPYQIALEQAEGQLARDTALLKQARMDLDRYQKLRALDSIARQTAEDQIYIAQQYEGTVKLDQAAVDNAKLNLIYCEIIAPVDGRIGIRRVDLGNYVSPQSATAIATITQMQPITVILTVAEDDLPPVMKRLAGGAELPVIAYDRSDTIEIAQGTLSAVGSQIDNTTGMVQMRATFANVDNALFPQQFVNAHLIVDTLHGVPTVPASAVQTGAPGNFVYVVNADQTVSVRTVKRGPSTGERIAILSGLTPGEHVVTDGLDRLRDGAKVAIVAAPPATMPAPPPAGAAPAVTR